MRIRLEVEGDEQDLQKVAAELSRLGHKGDMEADPPGYTVLYGRSWRIVGIVIETREAQLDFARMVVHGAIPV